MPRPRPRRVRPEPLPHGDDSPAGLARIRREVEGRMHRLRAVIDARREACIAEGRDVYPDGVEDFQLVPTL